MGRTIKLPPMKRFLAAHYRARMLSVDLGDKRKSFFTVHPNFFLPFGTCNQNHPYRQIQRLSILGTARYRNLLCGTSPSSACIERVEGQNWVFTWLGWLILLALVVSLILACHLFFPPSCHIIFPYCLCSRYHPRERDIRSSSCSLSPW